MRPRRKQRDVVGLDHEIGDVGQPLEVRRKVAVIGLVVLLC